MNKLLLVLILLVSACGGGDGYSGSSSAMSEDNDVPSVPAGSCGEMNNLECNLFKKINAQRVMAGVPALNVANRCVRMAQSHSTDMATHNFFSHNSPTRGSFSTRSAVFGIGGTIGENIAFGSSDLDAIVSMWMSSSGHRANILNTNFKYGGIGIAQDGSGQYKYTQVFSSLEN